MGFGIRLVGTGVLSAAPSSDDNALLIALPNGAGNVLVKLDSAPDTAPVTPAPALDAELVDEVVDPAEVAEEATTPLVGPSIDIM